MVNVRNLVVSAYEVPVGLDEDSAILFWPFVSAGPFVWLIATKVKRSRTNDDVEQWGQASPITNKP